MVCWANAVIHAHGTIGETRHKQTKSLVDSGEVLYAGVCKVLNCNGISGTTRN